MGKISPVSSKYMIHSTIDIEGVVDKPDVIGAIFGQTEGLLGSELELRELQRSGRIGRIEVNVDTKNGKTFGKIIIPSSLDKAETSIVGASLEIIQRIGPCNAKIKVQTIEDVRISKRQFVIERAKELLKKMTDTVLPDSQELSDEVASSVRVMEITEYGKDRLAAGPAIDDSDEILVVEGRADVINLLKHGFKNAIAVNGTSIPQTVVELTKRKTVTVFVDGDRGGKIIVRGLLNMAEIDYVTWAPDGKEVEEITKKEIHKALRSRVSSEQVKLELGSQSEESLRSKKPTYQSRAPQKSSSRPNTNNNSRNQKPAGSPVKQQAIAPGTKAKFKEMLEKLVGTKGAYIIDSKMSILGKVPLSELSPTLKSLSNVYAVILDGSVDQKLAEVALSSKVRYVVGMDKQLKTTDSRIKILTANEL